MLDAIKDKTEVLFTSLTVLKDKIRTIKTASSELWKYDIEYNNNGYFNFTKNGKPTPVVNPVMAGSQVATVVG